MWEQFICAWFDLLALSITKTHASMPRKLDASLMPFVFKHTSRYLDCATNVSFVWHCKCIGETLGDISNIETWRAVQPSCEIPWCSFYHNGNTLKRCTLLSIFKFFSVSMFWLFDEFKKKIVWIFCPLSLHFY